jgi:transglutaminase-like putative cysteine protease
MKTAIASIVFAGFLIVSCSDQTPQDVIRRGAVFEQAGHFREARAVLEGGLSGAKPDSVQQRILFAIDRLRRIRLDYRLTKEDLFGRLQRSVSDVRKEEFELWLSEGRFDSRVIDDTLRFYNLSMQNLFWRYPEIKLRRTPVQDKTALWLAGVRMADSIVAVSRRLKTSVVLPRRFKAKETLVVEADAVPPGEVIRAWLPIPRMYPYQKEFAIVSSSGNVLSTAGEDSPVRSAYMEQPAVAGKPTVFSLEFTYTRYGVHFDLDTGMVRPVNPNDPALAPYLKEAPHVVFTHDLRDLSRQIVGAETNPLRIARALYLWIAENLQYSHALEYSTLRNISDYVLNKRYGDCGQHALFFITLCRLNGIPARWQSGWDTTPNDKVIHDWMEIYLEPYGWVPADPDAAVLISHNYQTIPPEARKRYRDFFLGGLDQYRMAANSDHNQLFTPAKTFFRSDNVDFQRGEVEWKGGNIYFDRFDSDFEVEEVK